MTKKIVKLAKNPVNIALVIGYLLCLAGAADVVARALAEQNESNATIIWPVATCDTTGCRGNNSLQVHIEWDDRNFTLKPDGDMIAGNHCIQMIQHIVWANCNKQQICRVLDIKALDKSWVCDEKYGFTDPVDEAIRQRELAELIARRHNAAVNATAPTPSAVSREAYPTLADCWGNGTQGWLGDTTFYLGHAAQCPPGTRTITFAPQVATATCEVNGRMCPPNSLIPGPGYGCSIHSCGN